MASLTYAMNNKVEFLFVKGADDIMVLSLGTRALDCPYKYQYVKGWGALEWANPIMNIATVGVSYIVNHVVSVAFSKNPQKYVRVQVM